MTLENDCFKNTHFDFREFKGEGQHKVNESYIHMYRTLLCSANTLQAGHGTFDGPPMNCFIALQDLFFFVCNSLFVPLLTRVV